MKTLNWKAKCTCKTPDIYSILCGGDRQKGFCRTCSMAVGLTKHPAYKSWSSMLERCHNANHNAYKYYGGRGIKVCEKWQISFTQFLSDMGDRPTPRHSIDRLDNSGDYNPDNCRWATPKEQMGNTSRNRYFEFNGVPMLVGEIAPLMGISVKNLTYSISKGAGPKEIPRDEAREILKKILTKDHNGPQCPTQ